MMASPRISLENAEKLATLWDELEQAGTAEWAAFDIACNQLGYDNDEGIALMALLAEEDEAREQ